MMLKFVRFNTYFLLAFALLALTSGCQSSRDKKKVLTTLELHIESNADGARDNESIPIFRDQPIYVNVDKEPFLDGADVQEAKVVDTLAGFAIQIKFNWRGTQILAGYTTANRKKRIAVLCGFNESRWLAAPVIQKPITDGVLTFTPDATRDEADLIVKGLNDVASEMKKEDKL